MIKKYGHYKSRLDDIRLQRFKDLPHFSTITPCSIRPSDNVSDPIYKQQQQQLNKLLSNYMYTIYQGI